MTKTPLALSPLSRCLSTQPRHAASAVDVDPDACARAPSQRGTAGALLASWALQIANWAYADALEGSRSRGWREVGGL
jgi:hypothetical protein